MESVIREVKEETGLIISANPDSGVILGQEQPCLVATLKHWWSQLSVRSRTTGLTIKIPRFTRQMTGVIVFLYRTSDFEGDIHSTVEGEVRWVAREDVPNMDLAYDMLNLLRVFEEDQLSELFYRERLENDFIENFGNNMNYLFR